MAAKTSNKQKPVAIHKRLDAYVNITWAKIAKHNMPVFTLGNISNVKEQLLHIQAKRW